MKKVSSFLAFMFLLMFATITTALDLSDIAGQIVPDTPTEKVRLGIMKFTSKTYDVPDAMAAGISDFFMRVLFKADDITLVERERLDDIASELRLGMSGLVDPKSAAEVGKIAGADYMLLGAITNLARGGSGIAVPMFGIPFGGAVGVNTQKVKADLDVRVVDVETGEIVFADSASGEASKSDTGLAVYGVGLQNSEFGGIEGTAIVNAIQKLSPKIQKSLTGRDTLTSILAAELKKNAKSAKAAASKEKEETKTTTRSKRKSAAKSAETAAATVPAVAEAVSEAAATTTSETPEAAATTATTSTASTTTPTSTTSSVASNFENHSTDPAKVIASYKQLSSGARNTLRIKHLNLNKQGKKQKTFDEFVKLYEENNTDYLAAYKAGDIAQALRDNENAEYWYNKALEVNPDYEPAINALDKLKSAPKSTAKKRKK